MGKYMRKCRGAAGDEVAAVEVTQVVGVRTRSRAASAAGAGGTTSGDVAKVVPRKRKALSPATVMESGHAAVGSSGDSGNCYLQLRSRMLFKALPSSPLKPRGAAEGSTGAGQGAPLAAVLSRCSSTASSVDASAPEKSPVCRSEAAEAGGDHVPEGSASNSGCSRDRERRETTPSSQARGELSDLESDMAPGQKSGRPLPAALSPAQRVMPPAAEIEEFFAAAEAAEAERFASKYNFDVVRGVPLDAGRFEWTPVVSI